MFNKKRIVVIVSFIILSFVLITYGATRRGNAKLEATFIDSYDDKVIDEQIVEYEGDAEVPEDPKHKNYVFAGWYLYDSEDTLIEDFTNLTEDLKVEARYKDDKNNNNIADDEDVHYDVRFIDGVTSEVQKTESVLVGLGATAPTANSHEGYTFTGWDRDYSNITADLDVTSIYTENITPITMYTLRFFDRENNLISSQTIASGNASAAVTIPAYEGYTFDGWYLAANGSGSSYTIGSIVTSNLDIYGYWTKNNYEVITDPNEGKLVGGSDPTPERNIIPYAEEFELPVAERNYTLTYHENAEEVTINGQKVVTKPAILLGWCKNNTSCASSELIPVGTKVEIKEDVKYYAIWGEAKSSTIIIDATRRKTQSVIYTFAGWSKAIDGVKSYEKDEVMVLQNDLDLYAKWNETARQYENKIDLNGGSLNRGETDPSGNYTFESEFVFPKVNKSYTLTYETNGGSLENGNKTETKEAKFLGWCKGKTTCTTEELITAEKVEVDGISTYYAIWGEAKEAITLAGSTKTSTNTTDYEFAGWSETNGGVKAFDKDSSLTLKENKTIYAKWNESARQYENKIDLNGGSLNRGETDPSGNYTFESEFVFPKVNKSYTLTYETNGGSLENGNKTVTKEAKFLGWCKGKTTCTTEELINDEKVEVDGISTYYAIWGEAKEAITLVGATKTSTNTTDYEFAGWSETNGGVKAFDKDSSLTLKENKTIYAKWNESAAPYTVVIDGNTTKNLPESEIVGIIDTTEGNPSDLTEGNNNQKYGDKIKLPQISNKYVLTYNVGTGTLLNAVEYTQYVPAEFKGWCNKTSCTAEELIPALTEVTVEGEVTYTAVWGNSIDNVTIANADKIDDTEYDYTFDGWALTSEGAVDANYAPTTSRKISGNLTLYAIYSKVKQQYNEELVGQIDEQNNPSNLDEGDNILDHGTNFTLPKALLDYTLTYHVEENETVTNNEFTISRNANFLGWCKGNNTCTAADRITTAEQTVTGDVKYYAIFGDAKETIKIDSASKEENDTYTYVFVGWSTSKNGTVDAKYNVGNDITLTKDTDLYSVFRPIYKNYNLTLNPNGGVISENDKIDMIYNYNEETEVFPTPTKSYTLTYDKNTGELSNPNYINKVDLEFAGWCEGTTDTCETFVTSTKMTADKTYTAKWKAARELSLITATKDSTATKTYTFIKWNETDSANSYTYPGTIVLTRNTTLVAEYEENTRYYEVCFDSLYDKNNVPANQTKEYDTLVTDPNVTLTHDEHIFKGWANEEGSLWDFDTDKVLSNVNLYAKWENRVTFDTSGGETTGTVPTEFQEDNSRITLPGATKTYKLTYHENGGADVADDFVNAIFLGWCKDSKTCTSEELLPAGSIVIITKNTVFNAVWGVAETNILLLDTTKASDNTYTYLLDGWALEENSTSTYAVNSSLILSKDTDVYAVWLKREIPYTLTLNENSGVIAENDKIDTTYTYNEETPALPNPIRNYVLTYNTNGGTLTDTNADTVVAANFLGWCEGTEDTCPNPVKDITVVMTQNKTYTAKWGTSLEALTLTGAVKESTLDTNYTFKEWYYGTTTETVKNTSDTLYLSENLTINARYTESVREYLVKFESNVDVNNLPGEQTINYGSKPIKPADLTAAGYTFEGWFKENAFVTPWNFDVDTVNENTIKEDGKVHIYGKMNVNSYKLNIVVTAPNGTSGTATYNINHTLGVDDKYTVDYNSQVNITNINPTKGYYVKEIKLNNNSQTITAGAYRFDFNMPAEDATVEIILEKLTEEELDLKSPIRSFYIDTMSQMWGKWVDIRLKAQYLTCTGTRRYWDSDSHRYVTVPSKCMPNIVPDFYYSTIEKDAEGYLLDSSISLGSKYNITLEGNNPTWASDAEAQPELENITIDGGYHFHFDNINNLDNYIYFYVVYVENGHKYIIEYKKGTGSVNYTIEQFYSIDMTKLN